MRNIIQWSSAWIEQFASEQVELVEGMKRTVGKEDVKKRVEEMCRVVKRRELKEVFADREEREYVIVSKCAFTAGRQNFHPVDWVEIVQVDQDGLVCRVEWVGDQTGWNRLIDREQTSFFG
jgi:hypothetical protein